MSIKRFVQLNVVLVPLLAIGFYLFHESVPLLVLPFGVGYVTFALLISAAWGLSQFSLSLRSS